ncbi:hypothetical protein BHF68_10565 [Desulfuribacillus alkaliarsenatis]|uniref:Dehydrogenase n=1 Tax=Desulfuribacillus alkaliarsenatis TaxID=766136 RepID=A0A1E5FZ32_9FIRM|nr:hypothetical protein BHF68_10565 [Desulfuribacillus alkaliarsenatis]
MPDQTFNRSSLEQRIIVYKLASMYYQDGVKVINDDRIRMLIDNIDFDNQHILTAIKMLEDSSLIDAKTLEQTEFDYNKLFVGPGKVKAPPYESVYRNPKRLLMQQETLAVRNFYRKLGIECKDNGSQPDDHLGLELEFMSYLLHCVLQEQNQQEQISQEQNSQEQILKEQNLQSQYLEVYKEFLEQHILQWVPKHCEQVLENSGSVICRAMALLLKGMMEVENSDRNVFIDLQGGKHDERTMQTF